MTTSSTPDGGQQSGSGGSIQSKGGKARADKLTPEQRKEIAATAAKTRWDKERSGIPPRATHIGTLKILNSAEIPCAVLEDGTRVITSHGVMKAFGRPWKGTYKDMSRPNFLSGENLEPFIGDDLKTVLVPIEYQLPTGGYARGYKAEILPKVCDVYLKARDAQALKGEKQKAVASSADLLMRALAHVGIAALIDEATGYQDVRNKAALQAILDAFLRQELAAWAKRFPDDFYKEMFRLRTWQWNSVSTKRPILVGKLTNDVVYERLAPSLLQELEDKNPKDEKGRRASKHHQWFTDDIGHPALAQHLHAVIGLMRASTDWKQFHDMLDKAFPKRGTVLQLELITD